MAFTTSASSLSLPTVEQLKSESHQEVITTTISQRKIMQLIIFNFDIVNIESENYHHRVQTLKLCNINSTIL